MRIRAKEPLRPRRLFDQYIYGWGRDFDGKWYLYDIPKELLKEAIGKYVED